MPRGSWKETRNQRSRCAVTSTRHLVTSPSILHGSTRFLENGTIPTPHRLTEQYEPHTRQSCGVVPSLGLTTTKKIPPKPRQKNHSLPDPFDPGLKSSPPLHQRRVARLRGHAVGGPFGERCAVWKRLGVKEFHGHRPAGTHCRPCRPMGKNCWCQKCTTHLYPCFSTKWVFPLCS